MKLPTFCINRISLISIRRKQWNEYLLREVPGTKMAVSRDWKWYPQPLQGKISDLDPAALMTDILLNHEVRVTNSGVAYLQQKDENHEMILPPEKVTQTEDELAKLKGHSDIAPVEWGSVNEEHTSQRADSRPPTPLRQVFDLEPDPLPKLSAALNSLSLASRIPVDNGGDPQQDANEAVSRTDPADQYLQTALVELSEQGSGEQDLDRTIMLLRQALEQQPAFHPDRSTTLENLAGALRNRYQRGHCHRGDLDEAVVLLRNARNLQFTSRPNYYGTVLNLSSALLERSRLEQGAEKQEAVDEAIFLLAQALKLQPISHPDRTETLTMLADALITRLKEEDGQQGDLDEAISSLRQVLALEPIIHPNRNETLTTLADAPLMRSRAQEEGGQREGAISSLREVLTLQPSPHPGRYTTLMILARSLFMRLKEGRGQGGDLDEAMSFLGQVLALQPITHPDRSTTLTMLADALIMRSKQDGGPQEDLDDALILLREILALQPIPHPLRYTTLNMYAFALSIRFNERGDLRELDEAITSYTQCLELLPPPDPRRPMILTNLGNLFVKKYSADRRYETVAKAISSFSQATHHPSLDIFQFFQAARHWGLHADEYDHPSAIRAYRAALSVLPQLSAVTLETQVLHQVLVDGSDGLARKAARRAIRNGQLGDAVELLETGSGFFYSQMLHLRPSFGALPADLEDKLRRTAVALEGGPHRMLPLGVLGLEFEQEDSCSASLKEWSELVDEVRRLPGSRDFLQPRRFWALQAAVTSPVIILINNDKTSDCLVMTSTNVHHIPLRRLSNDVLGGLVILNMYAASKSFLRQDAKTNHLILCALEFLWSNNNLDEGTLPDDLELLRKNRDMKEARGPRLDLPVSSEHLLRSILRLLWMEVVRPVVDFLDLKPSAQELPTLHWYPTGSFKLLPMHAAGCYNLDSPSPSASDYFISSYTPTSEVLYSQASIPPTQPFKMTVIGSHSSSWTPKQMDFIQHVRMESLVSMGVRHDEVPSVETVASHLSGSSIVHFSCPGIQKFDKPLDSGLLVGREVLTISRIMQEAMPNGSLAFLLGHETAFCDIDKTMSLGASLLIAGFRRVITTMWGIRDEDRSIIADAFYEELFRGPDENSMSEPDMSKSAFALHMAVQKLRSTGAPFSAWVPFVHMQINRIPKPTPPALLSRPNFLSRMASGGHADDKDAI